MADGFIRECEETFVLNSIEKKLIECNGTIRILDVGCGNGHLAKVIASKFQRVEVIGIDLVAEMIKEAQNNLGERIKFTCLDALNLETIEGEFDIIISKRLIINILSRKDQLSVLKSIHKKLKNKGLYIHIESYKESLENLNRARKELNLPAILIPEYNKYLSYKTNFRLEEMGFKKISTSKDENTLSTHFFLTRVFHESIRPKSGKIKHNEFVKFFNAALPKGIGEYSPIKFKLFRKD